MTSLAKNLFLTLCVVATLLVILGLKQRFSGRGTKTLLSQPSANAKVTTPEPGKRTPRPRVLQAKPVTRHERTILSPTNSPYADTETEASPVRVVPDASLPTPIAIGSPRTFDAPELVPIDEPTTMPATFRTGDAPSEAMRSDERPSIGVAARPLPEFVLTDSEDSFWSISERVYGSGAYYRALFRHNEAKVLRPDQLRAGVEVTTPPLEVLRELYPADFPQDAVFNP